MRRNDRQLSELVVVEFFRRHWRVGVVFRGMIRLSMRGGGDSVGWQMDIQRSLCFFWTN